VDELVLSRMHTEWLVAWFYDRSRQMPPHVQERLESIGFIDGDNLTEAGRRWLQTRGPHTVSKLYHMAMSAARADYYQMAFGELSMDVEGVERRPVLSPDWLIGARIDAGDQWRAAWQAVASHRSQLPNLQSLAAMPTEIKRQLWGVCEYQRVFSTVNVGAAVEEDLFAGLRDTVAPELAAAA